jgi:hypothetical protein
VTRALAAFESGDGQTALDLLLERWRATRSPRLRRAITLLSQRLERPPIAGGTRERRFLEWRAVWPFEFLVPCFPVQGPARWLLRAGACEGALRVRPQID